MKFEQAIKLASENKKCVLFVDNGTSYGELHDFLMHAKGIVVDRINESHRQEQEAAEKVKEADAKKAEENKEEEVTEVPVETK